VEGGKTRFLSVRNAFLQISADPDDKILIHDAARPAVNVKMINTIITESKKYGEVIYGIKINETVKREFNNFVKETLVRDNLCAIQTPQIFRYKVLKNSYMKSTAKHDYTDESSMVESAGYRVRIIAGNRNNIKITTSDDLERMGKILKSLYRK
jgi:2-C-methyl-D-erythritol 4-phosphate cytidylyltransferase